MTNNGTSGTTYSLTNFDCTGGNYMVVGVCTSAGSVSVTSLNANGSAMSQLYSTNYSTSGNGRLMMYGLASPTTGDVALTLSGNPTASMLTGMLFSGVIGAPGTVSADFLVSARTGTTNTVASLTTDLVVDLFAFNSSLSTPTVSAGQTIRALKNNTSSANQNGSTKSGAASTTTMGWQGASSIMSWLGVALHSQ